MGEHCFHTAGVASSILAARTIHVSQNFLGGFFVAECLVHTVQKRSRGDRLFKNEIIFKVNVVSRLKFNNSNTMVERYGLGAQFFPRPHFEVQLVWKKMRFAPRRDFDDLVFLMAHFYP